MKTLIVLSGPPGCGKSTWASNYIPEKGNKYIVSSDELRKKITGSYQNWEQETLVWQTLNQNIKFYSSQCSDNDDCTVIVDATSVYPQRRQKYYYDHKNDFDNFELVIFNKPLEVIKEQNLKRIAEKIVPFAALMSLYKKFVSSPVKSDYSVFNSIKIIK